MDYIIRLEAPGDARKVERLTRDAFWNLHRPGASEHLIAHKLRSSPAFIPQLDFVAEAPDKRLLGNIMYSESSIETPSGKRFATITFGPLSVQPEFQTQGVGAALVRHSLDEARRLGHKVVIIFGHPEYYPRFGFVPAERFGITTAEGDNFDAFMALELVPGALQGVSGRFHDAEVFHQIEAEELAEFDSHFPIKRKGPPRQPLG